MTNPNTPAPEGWTYQRAGCAVRDGYKLVAHVSPAHIGEDELLRRLQIIAAAPDLARSAGEIDRLVLVITSAVNFADPLNFGAVASALNAIRVALAKARGQANG